MVITRDDKKLLDGGITIMVDYDYDGEGVYIDEDKLREEFEDKLEELLEIDICKCGFCGENLEEDSIYCSFECARADNTEGV
jgi:hypothetical protein|tara:strand:+ start:8873 stop:9118 length:246 start_codon:yes stop_codon:yes gene_type:complete